MDGSDNAKISDFGVSHICENNDDTVRGSAGTPAFMSPEACKGETYGGYKSDIWALGITLYALLYNVTPFHGESFIQIYNSIQYDDLEVPTPFEKDEKLKDLFSKLLDKNPETRITLADFLTHPWMTSDHELDNLPEIPRTPVSETAETSPFEYDTKDRLLLIIKMKQRKYCLISCLNLFKV